MRDLRDMVLGGVIVAAFVGALLVVLLCLLGAFVSGDDHGAPAVAQQPSEHRDDEPKYGVLGFGTNGIGIQIGSLVIGPNGSVGLALNP